MTGRPPLRLLHTSDVHLGAYDHGRGALDELRDRLHGSFTDVVDTAHREQVDAIVIAGDFIDNARVREETLQFAASEIARAAVPVVVTPGNHDHIGPGSVYDRIDFASLAPNLRLMRSPEGETVTLPELDVEFWGRSHTEQDPAFSPFADAPPRGSAAWHVAVGHGHFIHAGAAMQHSFHIREEQLAALGCDYVALGHWERLTRVAAGPDVVAAYSGSPESLSGGSAIGGRVLVADLGADGLVRLTAPALNGQAALEHDDIPLLDGA
jgi:DNA repair exonuclease SbcCD nuclease subunit